jgi:hypothetical protein
MLGRRLCSRDLLADLQHAFVGLFASDLRQRAAIHGFLSLVSADIVIDY